ncbi:Phosphorylated carbohydrates phosphatase TM_1254 [uncultured Roseburia sp.]|uniref:HAD family phosphatase n=1 Tax=Brotonthovivens ammoniilytica TaxID=2981725 RepID=A0ABT2TGJ9_9FIRM|nr:HAD family phosphatase [Brotonthovivens ammoniilytica]MCU6761271.1 HAD family phosphatase [Brotonthovivens ammoniilytica]SCI23911.1 Phosphorylated carbohydrates phosphatase TM_1254 [uncultured Roseburia sp.]
MLHKTKAVIFDLDGTMADSMTVWTDIDHLFFKNRGITVPKTLQQDIEGKSFTETAEYFVKTFSLPETVEELKAVWHSQAIEQYQYHVALKPGILEFLTYLKSRSVKIGIATSNSRDLLNAFLEARSLTGYIDVSVTSCDVSAGKPAPDVYLKTAELLKISPEECLVFEDVPMGILAGKRAGMKVCAVEDAYSADQRTRKRELADFYINDYFQILQSDYEVLP